MAEIGDYPHIIDGGLAVDDRGVCWFANDFHFDGVKRFYVLANHQTGFVRAWHGHKTEAKYVYVASGTAVIGAVRLDNWQYPSQECEFERFVLSARKPQVLYIPPGYANGSMVLEPDTLIFHFSTTLMGEYPDDDRRWPADYFVFPWKAVER